MPPFPSTLPQHTHTQSRSVSCSSSLLLILICSSFRNFFSSSYKLITSSYSSSSFSSVTWPLHFSSSQFYFKNIWFVLILCAIKNLMWFCFLLGGHFGWLHQFVGHCGRIRDLHLSNLRSDVLQVKISNVLLIPYAFRISHPVLTTFPLVSSVCPFWILEMISSVVLAASFLICSMSMIGFWRGRRVVVDGTRTDERKAQKRREKTID